MSKNVLIFITFRENKEIPDTVLKYLVNYAFSGLGMHRVSASVVETEQQSIDPFRLL